MKNTYSSRFAGPLLLVLLLTVAGIAIAQNQTNSTQTQSQSGTGQASSSASATARSGGSQSAIAGQSGGAMAGAASVGAPVKGAAYLVHWTPNLSTNGPANALSLHQDYVKTMGAKYGVLTEGTLGGGNGRLAVVQGTPQSVNEFAMGSPLAQSRLATVEITPYNIEFSRVGIVSDKKETPVGVGEPAKVGGGTSTTQGSGGG